MWARTDLGLEKDSWVVGPRPTEDVLAFAYLAWKQAGLVDRVFYQGIPSLSEFLAWHADAGKEVIGCWVKSDIGRIEFRGMGFVNTFERQAGLRKAEVGFCFDPSVGIFMQSTLIQACITQFFLSSSVDTLVGTTPDRNKPAVALIRRSGMRLFGPIPGFVSWHGEPCGAWISQVDRDYWFNLPTIRDNFPIPTVD